PLLWRSGLYDALPGQRHDGVQYRDARPRRGAGIAVSREFRRRLGVDLNRLLQIIGPAAGTVNHPEYDYRVRLPVHGVGHDVGSARNHELSRARTPAWTPQTGLISEHLNLVLNHRSDTARGGRVAVKQIDVEIA